MTQWIHTKKKVGCLNFMDSEKTIPLVRYSSVGISK
jgi:hypothetical protein